MGWLAALALSLAFVPGAQAAPCQVPGDYSTIQAAVDDPACATINVAQGGGIANASGAMTLTRVTFVDNIPDDCAGSGCP